MVEILLDDDDFWGIYKEEYTTIFRELNIAEKFGWSLEYVRNLDEEDKYNISAVMRGETLAEMEESK